LSLIPDEDILKKGIATWKGFADRLTDEDKETFTKTFDACYRYSKAVM
jgi:hypothetical protein